MAQCRVSVARTEAASPVRAVGSHTARPHRRCPCRGRVRRRAVCVLWFQRQFDQSVERQHGRGVCSSGGSVVCAVSRARAVLWSTESNSTRVAVAAVVMTATVALVLVLVLLVTVVVVVVLLWWWWWWLWCRSWLSCCSWCSWCRWW